MGLLPKKTALQVTVKNKNKKKLECFSALRHKHSTLARYEQLAFRNFMHCTLSICSADKKDVTFQARSHTLFELFSERWGFKENNDASQMKCCYLENITTFL